MGSQAFLDINGQRYDAITGQVSALPLVSRLRRNIDGILPADEAPVFLAAAEKLAPKPLRTPSTLIDDVVSRQQNHLSARRLQPARTLMRTAVKKPTAVQANVMIKVVGPREDSVPEYMTVAVKRSIGTIHPAKLARAQQAAKSPVIQRFHQQASHTELPATVLVPSEQQSYSFVPVAPRATDTLTTDSLLAQAIQHATSHEQPEPFAPRRNQRLVLIFASLAAFVVVSSALAATNMPQLKMYVAASRAGFAASSPQYQPSGYRLDKINASAGVVASNYLSNSDQRAYSLTQQPSNWDSETLRNQFVQQNAATFQTVEKAGLTIFLYGNGQATWVNHNVWYRVTSTGSLDDRQLVDLAASL